MKRTFQPSNLVRKVRFIAHALIQNFEKKRPPREERPLGMRICVARVEVNSVRASVAHGVWRLHDAGPSPPNAHVLASAV